ncbi:MAG: terminase small subunit [Pseudomonadota bacterium]|nr:terminase small subunit [Pseudomonadota bacterium]|tara:strand:+ start:940 stop:1527 length:588 start_codon:yes stop_codon:yes gene_type:complete
MEKQNTEPTENTIGKVGRPAGLTERQKTFAKFYVEGRHSNAECARMAGYSDKSSITMASKLLNGRDFPDVVELIKELRQAAERKYGVTLMHQLKRLDELSRGAEEAGQYSAAINAEKIRSALGGLTIDRREQQHVHQLDSMTKQDIVARLAELRKSYPHAFIEGEISDAKIIEDREEPLAITEETSAEKDTLPTD